jgi:hypothetical protein
MINDETPSRKIRGKLTNLIDNLSNLLTGFILGTMITFILCLDLMSKYWNICTVRR